MAGAGVVDRSLHKPRECWANKQGSDFPPHWQGFYRGGCERAASVVDRLATVGIRLA